MANIKALQRAIYSGRVGGLTSAFGTVTNSRAVDAGKKTAPATIDAKAGEFIHLPKGVPHKFELKSDYVKELMWIMPSGLEKWFWDNSVPAEDMQPLPVMTEPPPPEMITHFVRSLSEYGVEMV